MTRADITEGLVGAVSARRDSATTVLDAAWDVTIDGTPFLLAITPERPGLRATKQFTKQQFDSSKEPGEQTLSQWWVRSQTSWHRGAGLKWYEPGADTLAADRYGTSVGIDPWTKGQLTLHKALDLTRPVAANQGAWCTSAVVGGVDALLCVEAATLTRVTRASVTTYTGSSSLTGAPAATGAKVVVGGTDGLWQGDASGSTLTRMLTTTAPIIPWWVKSRIIAASGRSLYELTLASSTLPTPLYSHPDTGWTWTSVVETPDAILAAGYSGGYAAVYAFTLTAGSSGASPTLGGAAQVVELPPGETTHAMRVYLGAYIALGTSRGVRLGLAQDGGKVSIGPLTVESANPVRSITARDTYIYAAIEDDIEGQSGCVRIDLSQEIEPLRYAWAYDAQAHASGRVLSVAFLGNTDSVAVAVDGKGIYLQSLTRYEQSGHFTCGKIRYATAIPKVFAFAQVRSTFPSDSGMSLSTIDIADGDETFAFRFSSAYSDDSDVQLPTIDSARYALDLRIVLTSSTDGLATPVMTSLSVKALPQPKVQREVVWWLSCFDHEEDRQGTKAGYVGSAWERYSRLEWIEDNRTVIYAKDLRTGEGFRAWIDKIELTQTKSPAKDKTNWGGFIRVTLTRL